MTLTTASSRIGQGWIYKTLSCQAAPGSKSTARKIMKELPHFHDAEWVLRLEIPT